MAYIYHVGYSLASYYLDLIRSGIYSIKLRNSSVNVASVFVVNINLCAQI